MVQQLYSRESVTLPSAETFNNSANPNFISNKTNA